MIRGPFFVQPNVPVRDRMQELVGQAKLLGIHGRILKTLREIQGHLELHPEAWGEVINRVPAFKTKIYRRTFDEISVEYAVHDIEAVVFIVKLIVCSGHPLAD